MRNSAKLWIALSAIAICVLASYRIIQEKEISLELLTKQIDAAAPGYDKDHVAREGLKRFHDDSQLIQLSAAPSLTDSQKILLIVAYSRGLDLVRERVVQISKEESTTGRYASTMLGARKDVATSP
jgi:hypothetical protein